MDPCEYLSKVLDMTQEAIKPKAKPVAMKYGIHSKDWEAFLDVLRNECGTHAVNVAERFRTPYL